jgi:GNAT superfamily N-acetyltransferase
MMLDPMTALQRRELLGAMQSVRVLLNDTLARSAPCRLRGLQVGDVGWIVHRQGVLYSSEYGWDATYEALVAEILAKFVANFDPASEQAWVAERDGEIVGSVFLVRLDAQVAKLRLLYVEPSARGAGLGRRLVQECVNAARDKGYRLLTLWTNDVLVSARRIYEASGFELTEQGPHRAFGKNLIGQTWRLGLRP